MSNEREKRRQEKQGKQTNVVVGNNMNGTSGAILLHIIELKCLIDHSLPTEGCISVDLHTAIRVEENGVKQDSSNNRGKASNHMKEREERKSKTSRCVFLHGHQCTLALPLSCPSRQDLQLLNAMGWELERDAPGEER